MKRVHKKVSIAAAVQAAIQFALTSAPRVWGVLTAVVLVNIAAAFAKGTPVAAVFVILSALISLMAQAALFRLDFAVADPGDPEFKIGPLGFQWRQPETRLLGATLLLFFLFFLAVLFWVVIAIFCGATAMVVSGQGAAPPGAQPPQSAQLVMGVLALILAGLGVWVGVRVSLYQAATVASHKIMVFSTWRLTKGNFWAILGASVILLLPQLILTFAAQISNLPTGVALAIALVLGVVIAFVELPLMCGLNAHLYALLKDEAEFGVVDGEFVEVDGRSVLIGSMQSTLPPPGRGPWG